MKKLISKILILLGLVVILGSIYLKVYSIKMENKAVDNFEKKVEEKTKIEDLKIGEEMAQIDIPAISLNSIVIHGIENKYLNHYICHFENTAMPGENGNFSIAGHSSNIYNQVFNNLHKANIGDKINIKTTNEEFTYIITQMYETDPKNIEVLNQDNDIKEITIVTCSKGGKNRLIVKGLIEEKVGD